MAAAPRSSRSLGDLVGGAGGEVVADRDHLLAGGDLRLELVEEAEQVELLRVEITRFR